MIELISRAYPQNVSRSISVCRIQFRQVPPPTPLPIRPGGFPLTEITWFTYPWWGLFLGNGVKGGGNPVAKPRGSWSTDMGHLEVCGSRAPPGPRPGDAPLLLRVSARACMTVGAYSVDCMCMCGFFVGAVCWCKARDGEGEGGVSSEVAGRGGRAIGLFSARGV